jgi:hypothetical protein
MTNIRILLRVDLVPGRSFRVVLVNSLLLMRAGLSKHQAMAQALNVAGYRPRKAMHAPPIEQLTQT